MDHLTELRLREIIEELVGEAEIYGISANADESEIQARVFSDGAPYLYTFTRDPDSGSYQVSAIQPLGQQKL